MRVVIDAQGMQSESRFRGIGRYVSSFVSAVIQERADDEIILALNGLFPETIEPIRALYGDLIGNDNIRVWYAPPPVAERYLGNDQRREAAESMREAFLQSLDPDVIHVTSLFEGFVDDAVTSIGFFDRVTPVTVSVYDLIPLINAEHYLKPSAPYTDFYKRKLAWLQGASAYLGISESSCYELKKYLPCDGKEVVNVSTAIEEWFSPTRNEQQLNACRERYGLDKGFVLYAGGADERKNLKALIQAYAAVAPEIREDIRLVLAGRMPEQSVLKLKACIAAYGLLPEDVIFTGYVDDSDLVALYSLCALFVFPSWHEGFGLPALEAMACGAPVIGANATSIPEVIGLSEAMFDPFDIADMSQALTRGLTDSEFRSRLLTNANGQTQKFSWDQSAQKAWSCWRNLVKPGSEWLDQSVVQCKLLDAVSCRATNKRAVLPLSACLAMNQQAGVLRQLFVDVSELSQRDAATGVQRVVRSYLEWLLKYPPAGFVVQPVCGSVNGGYVYARKFTQHFMGLPTEFAEDRPITWCRGDVFFCLDMQHHVQIANAPFYQTLKKDGVAVKFLVYDLLPIELADYFNGSGAKVLHEDLMRIVAQSDGAICISKATSDALAQWLHETGIATTPDFQNTWVHIGADIQASHPSIGLPDNASEVLLKIGARPTFLCVSTIEPRKAQDQILAAMDVLWNSGLEANLVFVGKAGWKVESLVQKLESHAELGKRLFWLQGISDEYLEKVYDASNCLVAASINEGFGLSLVEAARHRLSIVARDIPVFREIAGNQALYFNGLSTQDLAFAMADWLSKYCAGQSVPANLAWETWQDSTDRLKSALLQGVRRHQLLVDVSELIVRDAKSGIQRVVRNILSEWLQMPVAPYEVVPVYASPGQPYRYCEVVSAMPLVLKQTPNEDKAIDYAPGDCFIGLDFQPQVVQSQKYFYQQLRRSGVCVKFVVYDLLSILVPQYFVPGTAEPFKEWLDTVCETDGAVCISKAVAGELESWVADNARQNLRPFKINWFHLGSDFERSVSATESESEILKLLQNFDRRLTFLMVGTLEPRKGHLQVLDAFEALWAEGADVNLVIAGKAGWMVDELLSRLALHVEKDHRLFWLNGISDGFLEKLYEASDCLIAASYGEGFGLPIVEAAQRGLPVLARDIPVFREVAPKNTKYFTSAEAADLADCLRAFLKAFPQGSIPCGSGFQGASWAASARDLIQYCRL